MRSPGLVRWVALLVVCVLPGVGFARVMAPAPLYERVGRADRVVVGKVVEFEKKLVATKGGPEFKIAIVKVEDALLNAKGLTHIKVGFIPGENRRFPQLNLQVGQEACFFLHRYPGESFYHTPMYFDVINKENNPNFAKEVKEVQRLGGLLAEAETNLQSKNAEDRYLTAAMLVVHYRTNRTGATQPKPIDAKRSELILNALASADWTGKSTIPTPPLRLFMLLNPQPRDGWTPPTDPAKLPTTAQQWLKDNSRTYRIQGFLDERE